MANKTNIENKYSQASLATADNLKTIARTLMAGNVSSLTLPEVDKAINIVSDMVPAGNVPGVILNGLARLAGKRPPAQTVKRDINLLFRGVSQVLDHAVYGALFAGPAAVIWGYQNLLKLAGKSPEDAFPEGTWQFYVDYALREDTARHTNETYGFDALLNENNIRISQSDRVTAWVITAIQILHQYDDLLTNEWRERIHTRVLHQQSLEAGDAQFERLYTQWERQRPYGRTGDAGNDTYPVFRRKQFDKFMDAALAQVSPARKQAWQAIVDEMGDAANPDAALNQYIRQMTIRSYLDPDDYGEVRTPFSINDAMVGIIHEGAYYLIPAVWDARNPMESILNIQAQVAAILEGAVKADPAHLTHLATVQRSSLKGVKKQLNRDAQASLDALRFAPILINTETRDPSRPLAEIRQTERGIGDHALTIFDTGETFAFDQSHIYFDGAWGAALAEIMTNEALSWVQFLVRLSDVRPKTEGVYPLNIKWTASDEDRILKASTTSAESAAESEEANINAILSLRKTFKQRSDLLQLTVNDLLVLYRAIHAVSYQPREKLVAHLKDLTRDSKKRIAANKALEAIGVQDNPAILIPVDASPFSPSERLYPMSFEVPLYDLDLLEVHKRTTQALEAYQKSTGDRSIAYKAFDDTQRHYLATLAGFGSVLSKAKEIATAGQSASVGSIRLLAHMPTPLQRLLDEIPSRVDMLNDIIKGKEVFSNVGAVASSSTLSRFITAKDDNEKKTLAWGVITDANRTMRMSLRDFRPHVRLLMDVGEARLAQYITQDYLDSYVSGLNQYIRELRRITLASRETRMATGQEIEF